MVSFIEWVGNMNGMSFRVSVVVFSFNVGCFLLHYLFPTDL